MDRAAALREDVRGDPSLRPAARIYAGTGEPDPESATAYLDAHRSGITLQSLQAAALEGRETRLPLLVCREGRYWLKDG